MTTPGAEIPRIPITSLEQLQEGTIIVANESGDTGAIISTHPAEDGHPATVVVRWDGIPSAEGIRQHELDQLIREASILE